MKITIVHEVKMASGYPYILENETLKLLAVRYLPFYDVMFSEGS